MAGQETLSGPRQGRPFRRGGAALPRHRLVRSAVVHRAAREVGGIDTPSIDYGQSKTFDTHRILLGQNIPAFENVAALERLPPAGAFVVALPMKIKGGGGGPLRIVALVPSPAP